MKHLPIGLLLLICGLAQLVQSTSIGAKREATKEEQDDMVEYLNEIREKIAREMQIPNMNELRYDVSLEKEVQEVFCYPNKAHRYMSGEVHDRDEVIKIFHSKSQIDFFHLEHNFGGLVAPEQTRVGCALVVVPRQGCDPTPPGLKGCAYGPKKRFPLDYKKGPPGSQCPNGKAKSGLCKAST